MVRGMRMSMPEMDPILDHSEKGLVERALATLRRTRPRDSAVLWAQLKRVALLGVALDEAPSLIVPSSFGGAKPDEATLLDELAHLDPFGADLKLPEKAVVARAFLWAKIAFLRAFLAPLTADGVDAAGDLAPAFRAELAQSIYTAIATEILVGLLLDGDLDDASKRRAARQLVLIWERAASIEIDDFCPMLENAWRARSRCTARFGTLLATSEYLRLLQEDCPPDFLDFFTRDGTSEGELQAFEEFLFNLTHEELEHLRATMRREERNSVDAAFVARVVGRPVIEVAAYEDPDALFCSYRRRRAAAQCRRLVGGAGPQRVAEAYIMIHLLQC
jgi:hypothetical protein